MDSQRIQEIIPHRDPFLLVDRVTELDPEEISIVAQKNITKDEPFLEGHFPWQSHHAGCIDHRSVGANRFDLPF